MKAVINEYALQAMQKALDSQARTSPMSLEQMIAQTKRIMSLGKNETMDRPVCVAT